MEQKYLDRIKDMSDLLHSFDGSDDVYPPSTGDVYPPSEKSVESLKTVLEMMDDLDMIDGIDPVNDIYPDNCDGVEIAYYIDDDHEYYVEIGVKDNFLTLSIMCNPSDCSYNEIDKRILPLQSKYYKPVRVAHKIAEYISYAKMIIKGVDMGNPLCERWTSITLDIYDSGLRFTCDDIGVDVFVDDDDVDNLLENINRVCDICDPDAKFCITEKGRKVIEKIKDENE